MHSPLRGTVVSSPASWVTKSGFFHFLGHEAKLWIPILFQLGLVGKVTGSRAEASWQRHVGDVRLEAARGEKFAKLAVVVQ